VTILLHGISQGHIYLYSDPHSEWNYKFGWHDKIGDIVEGTNKQAWESFGKPSKIKNIGWRVLYGMIPFHGIHANRHIGNQGGVTRINLANVLDEGLGSGEEDVR
jgi:hypothetical protein